MIRWTAKMLVTAATVLAVTACGGGSSSKTNGDGANTEGPGNEQITGVTEVKYTVTATTGEGGQVSPDSLEVAANGMAEFSLIPSQGYSVGAVTGCNGGLNETAYVVGPVSSNCSFHVDFQPAIYEVQALVGSGGSVEPMKKSVDHGKAITFTISPDSGFIINEVAGCDGQLVGSEYTTGAVEHNCYVEVSFTAIRPYDVTIQERHQSAALRWGGVAGTDSYNLYYATEAGVTPDNYATLSGGAVVQGVTSPFNLTGLDNGTYYYAVITAIDGTMESAPTDEVRFSPPGMNDTGLMTCTDATGDYYTCPAPSFPGQDAEFGRDILSEYGLLYKTGGGDLGFDFTKIGDDGTPLAIQNIEWWLEGSEAEGTLWSCVQDNVTGLMWEVKKDEEFTLRDYRNRYSWFDSTLQGVSQGLEDNGTCYESRCDTEGYVAAVNAIGLCGHTDWRMPTERELLGLVHYSSYTPSIDRHYFPVTSRTGFWTGQPSNEADNESRYVGFYYGTNGSSSQWIERAVRLVREVK